MGVLNILGGIFLEKTLSNSKQDRDVLAREKQRKDQEDTEALRQLFRNLDEDGDGTLSKEEFQSHLRTEEVAGFFAALDVDVRDAEMFFTLLQEESGCDSIVADDFIDNCGKLRGAASSFDVTLISYDLKLMRRELFEVREHLRRKPPRASTTSARRPRLLT